MPPLSYTTFPNIAHLYIFRCYNIPIDLLVYSCVNTTLSQFLLRLLLLELLVNGYRISDSSCFIFWEYSTIWYSKVLLLIHSKKYYWLLLNVLHMVLGSGDIHWWTNKIKHTNLQHFIMTLGRLILYFVCKNFSCFLSIPF